MEILCKFSTKFKVSISKTVFRSRLQTTMMMMTMMTTRQTIHDSGHLRKKRNIFWKMYFQYLEGKWIYPGIQLSPCQFTSYLLQNAQPKRSGKLFQLFFDQLERLSRNTYHHTSHEKVS